MTKACPRSLGRDSAASGIETIDKVGELVGVDRDDLGRIRKCASGHVGAKRAKRVDPLVPDLLM